MLIRCMRCVCVHFTADLWLFYLNSKSRRAHERMGEKKKNFCNAVAVCLHTRNDDEKKRSKYVWKPYAHNPANQSINHSINQVETTKKNRFKWFSLAYFVVNAFNVYFVVQFAAASRKVPFDMIWFLYPYKFRAIYIANIIISTHRLRERWKI